MNALLQKWTLIYNLGKLYKLLVPVGEKIKSIFKSEGAMNKSILQSKKSIAFLVSVGSLFLTQFIGLPAEQVEKILNAIQVISGLYFGSQGVQDVFNAVTQPKVSVISPNEVK